MIPRERTALEGLAAQLEEMWGHQDALFTILNEKNGWDQKQGAYRTFADVPYHLAYTKREIVVRGLELGPDYPEEEQELSASPDAIKGRNERKFGQRPSSQTVAQSLNELAEARQAIRRTIIRMNDADLSRPCWLPIMMGWSTAMHLLLFCLIHDWGEFIRSRIQMGLSEPTPSAAVTQTYLGATLNYFPMMLNKEAAEGRSFAAVLGFTDPGEGAWTIRVAGRNASLSQGATAHADLVLADSMHRGI